MIHFLFLFVFWEVIQSLSPANLRKRLHLNKSFRQRSPACHGEIAYLQIAVTVENRFNIIPNCLVPSGGTCQSMESCACVEGMEAHPAVGISEVLLIIRVIVSPSLDTGEVGERSSFIAGRCAVPGTLCTCSQLVQNSGVRRQAMGFKNRRYRASNVKSSLSGDLERSSGARAVLDLQFVNLSVCAV